MDEFTDFFDMLKTYPAKPITQEEIERLKTHYGLIWNSMSEFTREMLGLKHVTLEGYVRKNLKYYHGIDETESVPEKK